MLRSFGAVTLAGYCRGGESGDERTIIERVEHVQFKETIQNGAFGSDDREVCGAAGRVDAPEKRANRVE